MRGDADGERLKLARLLADRDVEDLAFLEGIPAPELAAYRVRLTDALFSVDETALKRTAEASRLLPIGLMATIGERGLGPLVCARVCGHLELQRAVDVAAKLPAAFCGQVAAELDPRKAIALVSAMEPERVAEVALQMAEQGEHVAMGRFVGHLPTPTLARCVTVLSDEDLVRIAFVMDGAERIDEIAAMLDDRRLASVASGGERGALTEEAGSISERLGATQAARVRELRAA